MTLIGTSAPHIEGSEKVTGKTVFTADVDLPGMLWGKVLRSPHPHARIRNIDTSAALKVPGVKAIVTGQDAIGLYMGKVLRDLPVRCWDRVRYIGDRVAAIAAETPEAAEEALQLIEVDYEEMPAVFDPRQAMQPEAPMPPPLSIPPPDPILARPPMPLPGTAASNVVINEVFPDRRVHSA